MTQQFHEGQDVEVWAMTLQTRRKAKIVALPHAPNALDDGRKYTVQFPDGSRGVFAAERIRAVEPAEEYPGLAESDDDTSEPMGSFDPYEHETDDDPPRGKLAPPGGRLP